MITVAVLGLGPRGGDVYGTIAHRQKERFKIVAVCDLHSDRRDKYGEKFGIEKSLRFCDAQSLFQAGKIADVLFVCSQDKDHYIHAVSALNLGYHLLLEKPISPSAKECIEIARLAAEKKRIVLVCHVLRYTDYFQTLKRLIDEGEVGQVKAIEHTENVGAWHYAHSYVRGNWCNTDKAAEMILAKCSHDFDILCWMTGARCQELFSYGALTHFVKSNAPQNSSLRCLDCALKDQCCYSAKRIYLDRVTALEKARENTDVWPFNTVHLQPSAISIEKALKEGDYGRCVYHSDNNVVDYQTVSMKFERDIFITLTMTGFTNACYRRTVVHGTKASIEAKDLGNVIRLSPFGGEDKIIPLSYTADPHSGHNGGDEGIIEYLYQLLTTGKSEDEINLMVENSIHSHILAKAAEQSRLSGRPIDIAQFIKNCR